MAFKGDPGIDRLLFEILSQILPGPGTVASAPVKQIPAVNRSEGLKRVLDQLLGFSKDRSRQMPFGEQGFKTSLKVRVKFPDGLEMVDEVKGLTPKHALEAAHRNWPGARVEPLGFSKGSQ